MPIPPAIWVLAAQVTGSPVDDFLGYGVLGLVVIAFITKQLAPPWVIADKDKQIAQKDAELARKDEIIERKDQELAALRLAMEEKTIPALVRATDVLSEIFRREIPRS